MKARIGRDEWWPVYSLEEAREKPSPYRSDEVEVSQELWNRYQAARREFDAVQDELTALYAAKEGSAPQAAAGAAHDAPLPAESKGE